jgi:hypothetical protein
VNDSNTQVAKPRRVIPIHPVLFAAFPILALYARNLDQVPLVQILRPLGLALAGTLAVWVVLTLLTRHVRKAAAAASIIAVPFFSYVHILALTPLPVRLLVLPLCIAGAAALLFAVLKSRKPLLDATAVLNVTSVFLVAPSSWVIGVGFWQASRAGAHTGEHIATLSKPEAHPISGIKRRRELAKPTAKSATLPDVYYIILDAYGRADSLKMFYGYDNSPFLRELERRGFYIAGQSRANYDETPLCLSSALDLTYLDDVAKIAGPSGSLEACREMLDDNEVAFYLSRFGYRYVFIGSGVGQARVDTADVTLNDESEIPMFEGEAFSLIGPHTPHPWEHTRYDLHRNRLMGVFNNLDTVATLPYQKFVFAHLLAPHPPFVFGAHGEAVYPQGALSFADGSWLLDQITREQYIERYIAQLRYVNARTLEAVDAILKQSRRPPIIVIQGDHGSRMNLNWDSLEKTDVREPFSILNAYLVPKKVRADLYDTISPVNSFRILLDDVFGAKFRRLPDRSFYSTADQPFGFTEVTGLLSRPRKIVHTAPAASRPVPVNAGSTNDRIR